MKKGNVVSGVVLLALSIWLFVMAHALPVKATSATGPGFFPKIIAALMAVMSVALIAREWLAWRRTGGMAPPVAWGNWKRMLMVLAAILGFTAFVSILGFLITTFLFLFVMLFLLEPVKKTIWKKLLIAAVMTAVVYVIFAVVFGASLPRGLLG